MGKALLFGIVLLAVLIPFIPDSPPSATAESTPADPQREREFQAVVAGARWIKSNMNNPKSFELVFAGMTDKGVACYQYRGTNEYNAVITTQRVISDKINSGSDADWNKHCGGKQMTNYTHARQAVF